MSKYEIAVAEKIVLADVRRCLLAQKWEALDEWEDIVIYRRPASERSLAEVVLPKIKDDKYVSYLLEAARNVAAYMEKSLDDVLYQWKNPGVDRVRFRIVSEKVELGVAPLNYIQSLVEGVLTTLRVAVEDVVSPAPFHKRVRSAEIDELMKRANFGQTERGSYVVNVFLPLGEKRDDESFDEAKNNVFRRGIEHLTTTLNAAVQYAESEKPNNFLFDEKRLNASGNLFDAILETRCDDDAEIEISVDWSTLLEPSAQTPSRVYVKKECAECFREWGRALRPKLKDSLEQEFMGKTLALSEDQRDDDNRPYGVLTLLIFDAERNFEAQAFLEPDEYKVAWEAYYNDNYVAFDGVCVWEKNKAQMKEIKNFRKVERPQGKLTRQPSVGL